MCHTILQLHYDSSRCPEYHCRSRQSLGKPTCSSLHALLPDEYLANHPMWLPCCVTHHGPFYNDFTQHFSPRLAAMAFGSDEKARHLQCQQDLSIRYIRLNRNAFVLQHSGCSATSFSERGRSSSHTQAEPAYPADEQE